MFNIYTHEKRLKEEKEKLNNKKKEENIEKNRKKELPMLCNSYEKRIKKFIYEMVDNPISLKEYVMPSMKTTRQDYINDKNRKYGGSSKFSFRKYKTDKERLEEYLKEKEENQKYIDRIKKENEEKSDGKDKDKYYSIEQPIMRYKPRTDLERIYYSVNAYSYGKISKEVINEQLSKLHLNDLKKKEDDQLMENTLMDKYKNQDENVLEELQTQKDFLNRQGYTEKNSETVKQIEMILSNYQLKCTNLVNNSNSNIKEDEKNNKLKNKLALKNQINSNAVKKMMGEYNTKTFFKAASIYSFNLNDHRNEKGNKYKNRFRNFSYNNNQKNYNNNTSINFFNHNNGNMNNFMKTNNSNFFSTIISGNLSNRNNNNYSNNNTISNNNQNYFLTFNEKDEPYYDEVENSNDYGYQTNYNPLNTNNFSTKKYNNNNKIFSNTNYTNFFSVNSRNNNINNFKTSDNSTKDSFPVFSSVDFNPLIKKTDENYDPKSLLYLKKISATNTLPNENNINDYNKLKRSGYLSNLKKKNVSLNLNNLNSSTNNKFVDSMSLRQNTHNDLEDMRKYDEEKITIDNETYLKSQIDLISKKILKKCNYLHSKSDFNNKVLKSGQGKLMITSGLTINDFAKKFNIPK